MAAKEHGNERDLILSFPTTGTVSAANYFKAARSALNFLFLVTDSVMSLDYSAYVAARALSDDKGKDREFTTPGELAQHTPGRRTQALRRQRQTLLQMLFSRAVDNFKCYIADIIREVLRREPRILSNSHPEYSIDYLMRFRSIEDLQDDLIEAKVSTLSYRGFGDLREWCLHRGISIVVEKTDEAAIVKTVATRNLFVHARGLVDYRYLASVGDTSPKIGDPCVVEVDDVFNVTNLLARIVSATDTCVADKFELSVREFPPDTPDETTESG